MTHVLDREQKEKMTSLKIPRSELFALWAFPPQEGCVVNNYLSLTGTWQANMPLFQRLTWWLRVPVGVIV